MSRATLRAKLALDKPYSFNELYELLAPTITPERALHVAKTRKTLKLDAAIISGKRELILDMIRDGVRRGTLVAVGDKYKLSPIVSADRTGLSTDHIRQWFQESKTGSLTLDEIMKKARPIVDPVELFRRASRQTNRVKMTRQQLIEAGLRDRVKQVMAQLARQGLLESQEVVTYTLRKFAKGGKRDGDDE